MPDKPGRRKRRKIPWRKVSGVLLVAILVVGTGYYVYENYIYKPQPIYARIDTSDGSFYVELFPACAPQTVANFVSLAQSGFYNDLVWHRIVKTSTFWIIQTGDPNTKGGLNSTRPSWGQGGSNQTVPLEVGACPALGNYAGYLGMARKGNFTTGQDTGTSQFYVNLSNSTGALALNGYYTVFGKVIAGMNVATALGDSPICQPPSCPSSWQSNEPLPPVFVNEISVLGTNPPFVNSTSTSP